MSCQEERVALRPEPDLSPRLQMPHKKEGTGPKSPFSMSAWAGGDMPAPLPSLLSLEESLHLSLSLSGGHTALPMACPPGACDLCPVPGVLLHTQHLCIQLPLPRDSGGLTVSVCAPPPPQRTHDTLDLTTHRPPPHQPLPPVSP